MNKDKFVALDLYVIKNALEKGGIYAENKDEFDLLLTTLTEINPRKYVNQ
jgi:hypothetical protein